MIIKREKKEERLFVDGGNVIAGQINFFINELVKIILLGNQCKQDIPHWIDNALGAIAKAGVRFNNINSIRFPKTAMFMGLSKSSNKKINQIVREEFEISSPEQYVQERVKDVYDQKESGQYKYRHLFNPSSVDWEDLFLKLKYIALCVSGQLVPEVNNYYDRLPEINFNKESKRDIKDLLEKIIADQFYL